MDIKTFKTIVPKLPPHIAVLVTGATGIGKSDIFHQIADTIGLEIIDRRLSQMTEGDIIGLPSLEGGVGFKPRYRLNKVSFFVFNSCSSISPSECSCFRTES